MKYYNSLKLALALLCLLPAFTLQAQKKDDIEYYTDSRVKRSDFSLALSLNPTYTDRRLIGEDNTLSGGVNQGDEADGSFQFNYGLDLYYRLSSTFDIGIGLGRATAAYEVTNVSYSRNRPDTVLTNQNVDVSMFTVPFRLNFNTKLTEIFSLEIVPMVELNILDKYKSDFEPLDPAVEEFSVDFSDNLRSINYSAGIGLGGRFYIGEKWDLFIRGNLKYMINDMVQLENYPRETLYSFGSNVGLKYSF